MFTKYCNNIRIKYRLSQYIKIRLIHYVADHYTGELDLDRLGIYKYGKYNNIVNETMINYSYINFNEKIRTNFKVKRLMFDTIRRHIFKTGYKYKYESRKV